MGFRDLIQQSYGKYSSDFGEAFVSGNVAGILAGAAIASMGAVGIAAASLSAPMVVLAGIGVALASAVGGYSAKLGASALIGAIQNSDDGDSHPVEDVATPDVIETLSTDPSDPENHPPSDSVYPDMVIEASDGSSSNAQGPVYPDMIIEASDGSSGNAQGPVYPDMIIEASDGSSGNAQGPVYMENKVENSQEPMSTSDQGSQDIKSLRDFGDLLEKSNGASSEPSAFLQSSPHLRDPVYDSTLDPWANEQLERQGIPQE